MYCRNGYSWDLETFTNTVAMEFEFVCTPSGLLSQLLTIVVVFFGCPAGGATGGWVSDTYVMLHNKREIDNSSLRRDRF